MHGAPPLPLAVCDHRPVKARAAITTYEARVAAEPCGEERHNHPLVEARRQEGTAMQFGVVLPTFTWPGLDYAKTRVLVKEFAQRAEHLGFDSLSVWDHLLAAPGLYGGSWL